MKSKLALFVLVGIFLIIAFPLVNSDLSNNLHAYYKFDNSSGVLYDMLQNQDGTITGTDRGETGIIESAINFDNGVVNSDYINLGYLNYDGSDDFTICGWFKPDDTTTTENLFSQWGLSSQTKINFQRLSNGSVQFILDTSSTSDPTIYTSSSYDNGWNYICGMYDGSETNMSLWFDGSFQSSKTASFGTDDFYSDSGLYFGKLRSNSNADYDGLLDEWGIWNRTLTSSEITELYNSGSGLAYSSFEEIFNITVTLNYPIPDGSVTDNLISFNATGTSNLEGVNLVNTTNFIYYGNTTLFASNTTTGLSSTTDSRNFTVYVPDGLYLWDREYCNENGECNSSGNTTLTVNAEPPELLVISPNETFDYLKEGSSLYLNVTATDVFLDDCWYQYNGTNTTFSCSTGVQANETFNQADSSELSLIVYANNTYGNMAYDTISWNYKIFENENIYNSSTYETANESFRLNLTTNSSINTVTLDYNGTEYSMIYSGGIWYKSIDILEGVLNKSFKYKINYAGDNIYSDYYYQDVQYLTFDICNATYSDNFLNISFKDEDSLDYVNASITNSEFIYYLGSGLVNKTLSYINTSNNYYYEFCSTATNNTLYVLPYMQYKQGTDYPQRIWNPVEQTYNSTVTNQILYLLSSTDGIYVTFQVVNSAEQVISGVDVSATREIGGSNVIVGTGTTGASGSVTFWLNPDFEHTFSFEKTGYDTYTYSDTPTQSSYTVTLTGDSTEESNYLRGISYSIIPTNSSLINDTTYTFGFNLTSSYWDVEEYGFYLRYKNGTLISGGSTGIEGTQLNFNFNTSNQSRIYMDYYWKINNTYTNGTKSWKIYNTEKTLWSIKVFFSDFKAYMDSGLFGIDNFGRYLIFFIIIFFSVGILGYKYGLTNPLFVTGLIFFIVFFLDVALGIIPELSILNGTEIPYLLTFISGLIFIISIFKEVYR